MWGQPCGGSIPLARTIEEAFVLLPLQAFWNDCGILSNVAMSGQSALGSVKKPRRSGKEPVGNTLRKPYRTTGYFPRGGC